MGQAGDMHIISVTDCGHGRHTVRAGLIGFKLILSPLGFNTGNSRTPIIPIIVGEPRKAKDFANRLYDVSIFVTPIVYPIVARGLSRIRIQMNSNLTMEQLDKVIELIEKIGKELNVI